MRVRLSVFAGTAALGLLLIGSAVALVASSGSSERSQARVLAVSPTGSDAHPCTAASPCLSFNRAYAAAAPGDVVEIAAGEYAEQEISGSKKAPKVVFRPAVGATVTVGPVSIHADQLELRNLAVNGAVAVLGSSDFATLRNVHLNRLYVAGARDLKLIGGDVGPFVDGPSWITHDNGQVPQRILIQGVHFHDFTVSDPGVHTECMLVIAGDGLTFRGNRWTNCAIYDLSFGFCCESPRPPTNVLIENNFFARAISDAGISVHFNGNLPVANFTIRHNSAAGAFALDQGHATFSNVRVIANIMPGIGCGRERWSYNVMTGSKCRGVGNKLVRDPGFVDPAAGDFHLTPKSPARNAGPKKKTEFAPLDFDGQKRPQGKRAEAGADERP